MCTDIEVIKKEKGRLYNFYNPERKISSDSLGGHRN